MLKKRFRLAKKDDIGKIIKEGNRLAGKFFLCKLRENGLGYCRFAVIVSKKVEKRAAKRNKCRRRVVEAIRNNVKDICGLEKTHDTVILANKNCLNASYMEIEQEIKKLKV